MIPERTSRRQFIAAIAGGSAAIQLCSPGRVLGREVDEERASESDSTPKAENGVGVEDALDLFSPEVLKYHIEYGDQARELLVGALDLHVHSSPDCFVRIFSHDELAVHARQYGVGGILLKAHCQGTADRLPFVRKIVTGIEIFGSITLNNSVGGLNPVAVEAAIEYDAKAVWLPTMDAQHHVNHYGQVGTYGSELPLAWERRAVSQPISLLGSNGRLKKEVYEILEMIGAANIILNIGGHISYAEMLEVLKTARSLGLERIIVEHPMHAVTDMPLSRQRELISNGAILNYVAADIYWPEAPASPGEFAKSIKELGVENIVLSSDGGAIGYPPYEMLLGTIQLLLNNNFSNTDIQLMLRDRPWDLVD